MDDSSKIRPYIAHLDAQLAKLGPEIDKFTQKSLNEQILLQNDKRAQLELSNRYAYVLSSLIFAYMKLQNVKDLTPIKQELGRVKRYMDLARQLDQKDEKKEQQQQQDQERAKRIINSALDGRSSSPAISKVNFQGKHTKFTDEAKEHNTSALKKTKAKGKVSKKGKN
ncbi:LANO_0B05468g1_1 [Lachancea nothofagi CBS 11611]|uniref:Exosome complex protein n=1 Tax=Lachancea nothofagi CBS 11611 TaxID=1266666 RepID=A0A1G4IYB9_9SACH|nr:LANO_0B05468g1_1 [Lachancea nothofagi CBS 11611]